MSRNFARFVGQFGIQNPIILDSFKFSVPLAIGHTQLCCTALHTAVEVDLVQASFHCRHSAYTEDGFNLNSGLTKKILTPKIPLHCIVLQYTLLYTALHTAANQTV